jgi:hypothetical protein
VRAVARPDLFVLRWFQPNKLETDGECMVQIPRICIASWLAVRVLAYVFDVSIWQALDQQIL